MPEQQTLWALDSDFNQDSIVDVLLYLGAEGRIIHCKRARTVLVALDLLPKVKKDDERGKKKNSQRPFRALNRSGRFIRVSHGRYRVNDFYRDTGSLSEKNMRLLRFLRSRQAS